MESNLLSKTLKILETYEFYDGPVFYSCIDQDDQIYLVVLASYIDDTRIWLWVPLSNERYNLIQSGKIDLHDAFSKSECGMIFQWSESQKCGVVVPWPEKDTGKWIPVSDIPEDYLPYAGEYL
jgi:hypothetical protein